MAIKRMIALDFPTVGELISALEKMPKSYQVVLYGRTNIGIGIKDDGEYPTYCVINDDEWEGWTDCEDEDK